MYALLLFHSMTMMMMLCEVERNGNKKKLCYTLVISLMNGHEHEDEREHGWLKKKKRMGFFVYLSIYLSVYLSREGQWAMIYLSR